MQSKSSRGVQQDDVWAAADALIAQGLRPTIERVRQKIGRGSPNTVSPMLEGWFATLGARLGVDTHQKTTPADDLPAPVRQAAAKLWGIALGTAQEAALQALQQAQQTLAAERAAIAQRETDLANREQLLKERQAALDEALHAARSQITDLNTRLEQAHAQLIRRDSEMDALQVRLQDLDRQRVLVQRRSEEEISRHAGERQSLVDHASTTERRLMTDLDRERQESKRLKSQLSEAERRMETLENKAQEDKQGLMQKLHDAGIALRSEHQALLLANARATELRELLEAQRIANAQALAQMSQLLTEVTHKEAPVAKPRKRVRAQVKSAKKPPMQGS